MTAEVAFIVLPRLLQEEGLGNSNNTDRPTNSSAESSEQEYYVDVPSTILFFFFGAIVIITIFQLSRMHQSDSHQAQEEEEARRRQEEIDRSKASRKLRLNLIQLMKRDQVILKLDSTDFRLPDAAASSMTDLDIETGMTAAASAEDSENVVEGGSTEAVGLEMDDHDGGASNSTAEEDYEKTPTNDTDEEGTTKEKMNNKKETIRQLSSMHGEILLPRDNPSSISNLCAICLDSYQAGETVVWSSNLECQHVFHQECILDYFVHHKQEAAAPCPCCRQQFFTKQTKNTKNSNS